MEALGFKDPLVHLCRREYIINCNWKVFCDNYLVSMYGMGGREHVSEGRGGGQRACRGWGAESLYGIGGGCQRACMGLGAGGGRGQRACVGLGACELWHGCLGAALCMGGQWRGLELRGCT